MIDWREAHVRVFALAQPVDIETVPLLDAAGRYASAPVVAHRTQPARDLSAMDGYAIRFADLPGPWRVIGESAAGVPFAEAVGAGETARIFTGAAVPDGADIIVIQEEVARSGDTLTLTGEGPPRIGAHIRRAGSDFANGDVLIETGVALTPARLALAAMGGHGALPVRRRVQVALLSTGDELVAAGVDAGPDRLPNSNAPMLVAMLGGLPVDLTDLGIVPDDRTALAAAFDHARDFDIVVTTGGASVGDHDLVRPVLLDLGATLDFWKVAMRPGKPLMAGTLGQAVVLGLPGNPVSAFVTATLFLLPLVRHLFGARDPLPPQLPATLDGSLPAVGARTDFVRARWSDGRLAPLPSGDSGALSSLAQADVLIVREAGSPALAAGEIVSAIAIA